MGLVYLLNRPAPPPPRSAPALYAPPHDLTGKCAHDPLGGHDALFYDCDAG